MGVGAFAIASAAGAQVDARVERNAGDDAPQAALGEARVRYGATVRNGTYDDAGPNLSYNGTTPNDVSLAAAYFPWWVGGNVRVQREGFALDSAGTRVTGGGLFRAAVGPAGRFALGPLTLDVIADYGFAQVPDFKQSASPAFGTGKRHSLLLASRAHLDLPYGAMVEADGEYPVALSVTDGSGASAKSSGFAAGGGVGFRVASTDRFAYVAWADYQYVSDSLTTGTGAVSSQTLHRLGLSIEVQYLAPKAPVVPRQGSVLITVLDAATSQPLANVGVEVDLADRHFSLTTAANGQAMQADVPEGVATVKATLGGYLPESGSARVVAGQSAAVALNVRKEPPKVGALALSFVDKESQKPVAGVKVAIGDRSVDADDSGAALVKELPPGPIEVKAKVDGYRPAQEVAQVVAGQTSPVAVSLVRLEQKQQASITGIVRSARTGEPVSATLEIPQAKVRLRGDEKGGFSVHLPGGVYRVIISASGYISQTKSVTVKEGDEVIFNVDLHPVGR